MRKSLRDTLGGMVFRKNVLIVVTFLVFLAVPFSSVSAHGLGASMEREVEGYFVDVGYDPSPLRAERAVRFDFELYDEPVTDDRTSARSIDYTSVWVRLEQEGRTILATGVAKALWGPTTLLMDLPSIVGPLTIHVRYERGEEVLVGTSFTLNVEQSPDQTGFSDSPVVPAFGGLVVGAALAFFIVRRRRG